MEVDGEWTLSGPSAEEEETVLIEDSSTVGNGLAALVIEEDFHAAAAANSAPMPKQDLGALVSFNESEWMEADPSRVDPPSAVKIHASEGRGGAGDEGASLLVVAPPPVEVGDGSVRRYDVSITYDSFYCTPRLWLFGIDESTRRPLKPKEVFQDVMGKYQDTTASVDPHPSTGMPTLSIHPCRHAA
eukprot:Filipodium_phascolosomae@DN4649_c0_g1_i1.p1